MDFAFDRDEEEEEEDQVPLSSRSSSETLRPSAKQDEDEAFFGKGPKFTKQEVLALGKELVREFFASKTAYDVMAKAGRVVVFDVGISLRSVLGGLLENDIKGASLWSPDEQRLVGVITLTDFADLYRHCYQVKEPNPNLIMDSHTVNTWRAMLGKKTSGSVAANLPGKEVAASLAQERPNVLLPLHSLSPTSTLLEAVSALLGNKVNRMPVVDGATQTMLYMMTLQTILDYMVGHFMADRNGFLEESIYHMGVGTYCEPAASKVMECAHPKPARELITATPDMKMSQVCDLFAQHHVSIVPIVDPKTNWVRDLFNRSYLPTLKWSEANWFERPVSEVIDQHASHCQQLETVHTCSPKDSLVKIITQFFETKARILVVVDHDSFCGVVTLSDVFGHFV